MHRRRSFPLCLADPPIRVAARHDSAPDSFFGKIAFRGTRARSGPFARGIFVADRREASAPVQVELCEWYERVRGGVRVAEEEEE